MFLNVQWIQLGPPKLNQAYNHTCRYGHPSTPAPPAPGPSPPDAILGTCEPQLEKC